MLFTKSLTLATLSLLASAFDASSNRNLAVYWGQNAGNGQQPLASYCQNADADIVIVSFLNDFPQPGLNLANACGTTFEGSSLLHCPSVGEDIKTCQKAGKKVFLSLGGAYGKYGFSSDSEAEVFASTVWNKFGAGSGDSQRPFDDAVFDGFDLDLEHGDKTGTVAFVNALKSKFGGEKYYVSASPQCNFPDPSVGDVVAQTDLDFVFIQFYNNNCAVDKSFNWNTWNDFAKNGAANKNLKLFLGLPAGQAIPGYITPEYLEKTLDGIHSSPNFGGVSLWDASFGAANVIDGENYIHIAKKLLNTYVPPPVNHGQPSAGPATSAAAPSTSAVVPTTSAGPRYTTVANLTSSAVTGSPDHTVTATHVDHTVITITSCADHKCTEVPVTTGVTTVTLENSIYVTWCPLDSTSTTSGSEPQPSAPAEKASTLVSVVPSVAPSSASSAIPEVSSYSVGGGAASNSAKYGIAFIAALALAL